LHVGSSLFPAFPPLLLFRIINHFVFPHFFQLFNPLRICLKGLSILLVVDLSPLPGVKQHIRRGRIPLRALFHILFDDSLIVIQNIPLFCGTQISDLRDKVLVVSLVGALQVVYHAVKVESMLTKVITDGDLFVVLDFVVQFPLYSLFISVPYDLEAEDFWNLIKLDLTIVGRVDGAPDAWLGFIHLCQLKVILPTLLQRREAVVIFSDSHVCLSKSQR